MYVHVYCLTLHVYWLDRLGYSLLICTCNSIIVLILQPVPHVLTNVTVNNNCQLYLTLMLCILVTVASLADIGLLILDMQS